MYVIIPDGFSLKKVNKAQKDAVDAYFRHENTRTLLQNVNTPVVVGGAIATFFGVRFASDVIKDLEAKGLALTDEFKQKVREAVDAANPLNVDITKVAKGLGVDTGPAPSATLEELLAEARRRFF